MARADEILDRQPEEIVDPPLHHGTVDVLRWLGMATADNLAGGVGFVTFFRLAQAREKKRSAGDAG
jgi:hypothetical protein